MMFRFVPPWMSTTVTTAVCCGDTDRLTTICPTGMNCPSITIVSPPAPRHSLLTPTPHAPPAHPPPPPAAPLPTNPQSPPPHPCSTSPPPHHPAPHPDSSPHHPPPYPPPCEAPPPPAPKSGPHGAK